MVKAVGVLFRIAFLFFGIHKAKHLSILCSDFRFFKGTLKLYRKLDIDFPDEIKIPGGIKSVAKQNELVLGWILKLHELHAFEEVILIAHSECGAYKGEIDFENSEEEQLFHEGELRLACGIVKKLLPQIKSVKMVYAKLTPNGKLIEYEEIVE